MDDSSTNSPTFVAVIEEDLRSAHFSIAIFACLGGTRGECWDGDGVADGSAVATTMEREGLSWKWRHEKKSLPGSGHGSDYE